MHSWTKKLKPIIWVVLFCFSYTAVGGSNFVYAASEGRIQKSEVRSQKEEKTTAQKWTSAIEGLQAKELRVEELRVKENELKELDKELRKEFKETEAFLKDKKLPDKILQRHYDFVKQYERNFAKLQDKLTSAISAKSTEQRARIKDLQDFIEQAQYKPKPRPLDPNKLPHRLAPKLKPREPRMSIEHGAGSMEERAENREQKAGISPAGGGQGGGIWTEGSRQKSDVRCQNERLKPELQSQSPITDYRLPITNPLLASAGFPDTFVLTQTSGQQSPASNSPTPADLSETIDVQLTPEIRQLATNTLKSNPVLIYEYVRNNFDYEPYYGSLKGSQETLWEKAGNDFDQASLLIALYRAAGIPARYVYGTIEIPIEKAMNWVGVKDKKTCGDIFASGGIPSALGISGGEITKLKIEHIWVEIYIPYLPEEGVSISRGQKMWIPLDPSFKQYTTKEDIDLSLQLPFDTNAYLSGTKTVPPVLEYFNQLVDYLKVNMPDKSLVDILRLKGIIKEELGILPDSFAYDTLAVLDKYAEVQDNLRHKISFKVGGIDYMVRLPELSGKRITLSYIPATVDDEKIVEAYGGLYYTPAYLIDVKPLLKVEGIAVSTGNKLGMGSEQEIIMEFDIPNIGKDRIINDVIAGGYYGIGVSTTNADLNIVNDRIDKIQLAENILISNNDDQIGELLNSIAISYLSQTIILNKVLESIMHVVTLNLPSEGISSLKLSVDYLFGVPHSIKISGINIDVDRQIVTPFSITGDTNREKQFLIIAGLNMSFYEHSVLEQILGVDSISAVKALQIANESGIPLYQIDKTNINEVLPVLQISETVKNDIKNAVNAGRIIIVSERNIQRNEWSGVGYIIQNPDTGEGAYMISGGLAGADSTLSIKSESVLVWISSLCNNKASIILGEIGKWGIIGDIILSWYWLESYLDGYILWTKLLLNGYLPTMDRVKSKDKFFSILKKMHNKVFYFVGHIRCEDLNKNREFDIGEPLYLVLEDKLVGSDILISSNEIANGEKSDYFLVFLSSCFSAENNNEFFIAFETEVGIGWKKDNYTPDGSEPIENVLSFAREFWERVLIPENKKTIREVFKEVKDSNVYYSNAYLYEK